MSYIEYAHRVGRSTISTITADVSEAIWNVLKDKYVYIPPDIIKWEAVSNESEKIWNFPLCLGTIDEKESIKIIWNLVS